MRIEKFDSFLESLSDSGYLFHQVLPFFSEVLLAPLTLWHSELHDGSDCHSRILPPAGIHHQ